MSEKKKKDPSKLQIVDLEQLEGVAGGWESGGSDWFGGFENVGWDGGWDSGGWDGGGGWDI